MSKDVTFIYFKELVFFFSKIECIMLLWRVIMKIVTIDGNEATSLTSYLFTEVAGIYPITPSSPMAENTEHLSNKGEKAVSQDFPSWRCNT